MRVAIVHHWFVTLGGGERVAEVLAGMFPEAELFSLFVEKDQLPPALRERTIHTSFLQKIPGARKIHRHLLPLYPYAVEALDLTGFDLVITSDSGPMKGIVTNPHATHICYCHSPMRYVWDGYNAYMRNSPALARIPFSLAAHYVRNWDYIAAQRVDRFVANSRYVAFRIARYYGRESSVIHPPVETRLGSIAPVHEDYYLAAGRLVGYKKTDLMIEACNRLRRRLRVVGDGPEYKRLKRMAG
ncbi:MAG TPA: glycosyltransferase, partial [Acidobacteriaceae bacterium]